MGCRLCRCPVFHLKDLDRIGADELPIQEFQGKVSDLAVKGKFLNQRPCADGAAVDPAEGNSAEQDVADESLPTEQG